MDWIMFLKITVTNIMASGMAMLAIWAFGKEEEKKQKQINLILKYLLVSSVAIGFGYTMQAIF